VTSRALAILSASIAGLFAAGGFAACGGNVVVDGAVRFSASFAASGVTIE
jgi:hypothetical protein